MDTQISADRETHLERHVCFNFYSGWRQVSEYFRKYLPDGISLQQQYVLELCGIREGLLVNQIARSMALDAASVSGLLRRMERSGLVRREVRPENRRETLVFLTPLGLKTKENLRKEMSRAENRLSKTVTAAEMSALIRINKKIRILLQE